MSTRHSVIARWPFSLHCRGADPFRKKGSAESHESQFSTVLVGHKCLLLVLDLLDIGTTIAKCRASGDTRLNRTQATH